MNGGPSKADPKWWKKVWSLNIPPRIRIFAWRLSHGAIPTKENFAKRILSFNMGCAVCSHYLESEVHILLQCPLALQVWGRSTMDNNHWAQNFPSMRDCLEQAAAEMDLDQLGEFVAICWEIWNARNRHVFGRPDSNLEVLSSRGVKFVISYRELREKTENPKVQHQALWRPPGAGMMKLYFDGGKANMDGRGWGFVVWDPDG